MNITIAYVPDKKILGLSKLSRIAGYFARRLQYQERTAHLIAAFIERILEPLGVAVLICGTARNGWQSVGFHSIACDQYHVRLLWRRKSGPAFHNLSA